MHLRCKIGCFEHQRGYLAKLPAKQSRTILGVYTLYIAIYSAEFVENMHSKFGRELASKSRNHIKRIKMERDLFASPFVSEPSSESNREKQLDWDIINDPIDPLHHPEFENIMDQDSLLSQHDSLNMPTSSPLYSLPPLYLDSGFDLGPRPTVNAPLSLEPLLEFVRHSQSQAAANRRTGNGRERRANFTPKQRETLNKWLVDHSRMPYPSNNEIESLSALTGLTTRQIRVYLTNGRIRLLRRRGSSARQKTSKDK